MTIERIQQMARESIEAKRAFFDSHSEKVALAVGVIISSIRSGGKVLILGNGGSAADAQHIAAELVNRLNYDRPPIAAIALTTDTSILTSIGNDSTFDELFERQLRAIGRAGDVAIAISTSGNSPNVLRAMEYANSVGCRTIALTGRDGGKLGPLAQLNIQVAVPFMGRIEDAHMIVCHMIGYYFMDMESCGS